MARRRTEVEDVLNRAAGGVVGGSGEGGFAGEGNRRGWVQQFSEVISIASASGSGSIMELHDDAR